MAVEPLLATRAQRGFILTEAIAVLVMVAITFRLTLSCYLALFALAEIFELFMCYDALRLRNVIQLVGILLFHLALMVMAALQVHQTRTALVTMSAADCASNFDEVRCAGPGTLWNRVEPYLIVAPCLIGASLLVMIFWMKHLYAEFGWAVFHIVGANPKMKEMYRWYQIMICLLKFDFFFFIGVTMQLLIVVLNKSSAEFGITIAAIPVVLVLLVFCGIAVQREIKWIMAISQVLMLAAMSYLYKLVRFYQPGSREEYATTRATLTTFTIVAFIILFLTFAVGLRCFSDFDRGLQPSKVNGGSSYTPVATKLEYFGSGNMSQRQSSYMGGAPVGSRISIE
ncbi:hypothetical protein EV715DRAFT_258738 [Schizophyllum commune]